MADIVTNYLKDRWRELRPPSKEERSVTDTKGVWNALKGLTFIQWFTFWVGWVCWTCDALDFFAVSLTVTELSETFDRSTTKITQSITLTLLFRSLGALIFGLASDRYGRKWPLIFVMYLITVLQIGTSFTQTFQQFLALRSLFGIAMGGVWGMSASTSLETLPVELRGLASGVLQQGYAVGYLIGAVVNLTLVPSSSHSWRALFWVAAGISFFAGTMRIICPESPLFIRAKADRKRAREAAIARGEKPDDGVTKTFVREVGVMLQKHWLLFVYGTLLMTGFNFLSHGSQDLYPTYLRDTKGFSNHQATVATIIGNCGAIAGGVVGGWGSQYLGRRLVIIILILSIGAFIPLWILPDTFSKLSAGAFCVQFGVQGAWGVIPIQLAEMSPPAFRATFPGLVYQLGNAASSASSQIESTGGEHLRTTINGKDAPDYATVQGILIGVVAIYTIIITFLGPEKRGSQFEKHALAIEQGGGKDEVVYGADEIDAKGARDLRHDVEKGSKHDLDSPGASPTREEDRVSKSSGSLGNEDEKAEIKKDTRNA